MTVTMVTHIVIITHTHTQGWEEMTTSAVMYMSATCLSKEQQCG